MIIVNLKGGLGNQMFQYACGRALALKNNDTLTLDTTSLMRANATADIYRPFSLASFQIEETLATNEEIQRHKYPYGVLSKIKRLVKQRLLRQHQVVFDARVLTQTGDIYLDGFWQSPNYFTDIRSTLLTELTLKEPLREAVAAFSTRIKNTPSVAVHVRRGDYANNPRVAKEFGLCTEAYYAAAHAHMEANVLQPTYFIFSDDLAWVKENLATLGGRIIYVEDSSLSDAEELYLMSLCQHQIIANSSFSWWGAWLNQNPEKIVIAPTPWFDTIPYDPDLIPTSWITLPK